MADLGGKAGCVGSSWDLLSLSRRFRRGIAVGSLCLAILTAAIAPLLAHQLYSSKKAGPSQTAALIRKRAEWFFRQRATRNGHVPTQLLLAAYAQNLEMTREHGTFLDPHNSSDVSAGAMTSQLAVWTPLGPQPTVATQFYGNVSGRVTSLAADPCDPTGNTVYAGAADGGVWASFNALTGNPVTWHPLTDDQPSLATGAIAINAASCGIFSGHSQSDLIVVGTGESNFAQDNLYGAGVLRSSDGGATWQQDATFTKAASQGELASGPYIAALAIQPNHPNPVILAAVQGTDFAGGGGLHSGIYRSVDGGAHWTRAQPLSGSMNGAPFNTATDVIFDATDPQGNRAYAALGDPIGDSDPKTSCGTKPCNGVYVSDNVGQTWSRVTGVDSASSASLYGRISLAIAPGSSTAKSKLFVAIADASAESENLLSVLLGTGISPNGSGATFTAIYPTISNLPDFCEPLCYDDMKLAVVPGSSGSTVFAGGAAQPHLMGAGFGRRSIYRSADGGNTWADFSADGSGNGTFVHVDVHAFDFALGAGSQILGMFVGNDGGVWSSADAFNAAITTGNQHWADLNSVTGIPDTSLNITQFFPGISLQPSTDPIIFGGTQGNDVQQFTGSLSWSGAEACPYDGGYTAIDQQMPSTVYAACNYLAGPGTGTLNKNTRSGIPGDDGINWVAIDNNNGIDFSDNADFIPPFVIDPEHGQNLYFGTFRLYQTKNAGTTWSAITRDLTGDGNKDSITAIAVAPSDSNTIYAGTSDGSIWQSSQALAGATDIHDVKQAGEPSRQVSAIVIDPLTPQSAFLSYSGFSCPGISGCDGLGHLFFTNNSGAAWTRVDGNLPDVPVDDIVIDPADSSDNTVYLATDAGVYASANATTGAGTTWSILQTGLPNSQVLSLRLNAASRTLVAATHGRGVWNIKLPASSKTIALTSLDPISANAGDSTFTLTASGSNFTPESSINFNGTTLASTFVNSATLTTVVPASQISCAGSVFVSVTDPVEGSTNPLRFTVSGGCDFSFGSVTPPTEKVPPGATATYQIVLNTPGSTANPVQLSCLNPPVGISCQFSPNPATPTQAGTTVTLTIVAPSTAVIPSVKILDSHWKRTRFSAAGICFIVLAAIFATFLGTRTTGRESTGARRRVALSAVAVVTLLCFIAACGGGSGGGGGGGGVSTGQTFTITIQGVAGAFQHLTSVQLVVD